MVDKINMTIKRNCWDVRQCSRIPGGDKVGECGVCPAFTAENVNGVNGGENGGRFCWTITGTLCDGEKQPVFALKIQKCLLCDFFNQVAEEEDDFVMHL